MLAPLIARLDRTGFRYGLYAGVGLLFFTAALGTQVLRVVVQHKEFDFAVSDGRGYYVYLPALFIDGGLDFSRQYAHHWGPDFRPDLLSNRTALGYPRNKYPPGLAFTLLPAFLGAHGLSHALYRLTGNPLLAPDGYTLLYQVANVGLVMGLGWLSLLMTDRLLVGHFRCGPRRVAAGVVAVWLGSPFAYYCFREPLMVHVVSGFWVMAGITLTRAILRRLEPPSPVGGRLGLLAFTVAMSLTCRPTDLFIGPFLVYLVLRLASARVPVGQMVCWLPGILGGLTPLVAQAACWRAMTGRWLYYSYEGEGFDWLHPALVRTLFSSRHGLFFWSPLLLLSVGGLVWRAVRQRGRRDPLLVCYVLSGLCLWYFNSAWHCWWFGDAFGGRAFVELSGLFVFGLVFLLEYTRTAAPRLRALLFSGITLTVGYSLVLMGLYLARAIPRGDYLF
jgi:hypothetical protein